MPGQPGIGLLMSLLAGCWTEEKCQSSWRRVRRKINTPTRAMKTTNKTQNHHGIATALSEKNCLPLTPWSFSDEARLKPGANDFVIVLPGQCATCKH
jgi:hypothetical protein